MQLGRITRRLAFGLACAATVRYTTAVLWPDLPPRQQPAHAVSLRQPLVRAPVLEREEAPAYTLDRVEQFLEEARYAH